MTPTVWEQRTPVNDGREKPPADLDRGSRLIARLRPRRSQCLGLGRFAGLRHGLLLLLLTGFDDTRGSMSGAKRPDKFLQLEQLGRVQHADLTGNHPVMLPGTLLGVRFPQHRLRDEPVNLIRANRLMLLVSVHVYASGIERMHGPLR